MLFKNTLTHIAIELQLRKRFRGSIRIGRDLECNHEKEQHFKDFQKSLK